jgi:diadenosine tetraphosphatase ApaH/serine/threonine PP2A family protein phosphatase
MHRSIVIGDIHGCYEELEDLLRAAQATAEDRIFSVGDLVTKGPASREVLEFFCDSRNTQAVLGNHEYALLRYYKGEAVDLEPAQSRAIAELGDAFDSLMNWVSGLPHYLDLGSHMVVHAGIRPGLTIEEQTVEDLTELRTLDGPNPRSRIGTPWFERYEDAKVVIFGHWVFATPLVRNNAMGIDTGCVYGGRLTAVVLPDERLVSVPARRAYAERKE